MNDRLHEGRRPGAAAGMTSLNGGVATAAGRLPPGKYGYPSCIAAHWVIGNCRDA